MTTRSGFFWGLFTWFSTISILMAQENTPSGITPIAASPTPSSSPSAPASSSVTPTPSPTPPQLTGGVFKTNDNGITFEPIFDKEPMLSIGALAVGPSDSDVIWAGTGEANDRNSSDWGDGVYRSTDGGGTWQNVGLKSSRSIARILVDPKKTDVAYVAAMGNLWEDGGERGLFKTTDAGKTWKLVLKAAPPHDRHT